MKWFRRTLVFLTIAYWIGILTLTHLPPDDLPSIHAPDKLAHFLAYWGLSMALGVLGLIFWPKWRLLPLIIIPIVAAYGAFDEITQPMFHRDAELNDWFADCTGAAIAMLIIFTVQTIITKRMSRRADVV
jgi:VanZ family protein